MTARSLPDPSARSDELKKIAFSGLLVLPIQPVGHVLPDSVDGFPCAV
jgi:hypothetical protein